MVQVKARTARGKQARRNNIYITGFSEKQNNTTELIFKTIVQQHFLGEEKDLKVELKWPTASPPKPGSSGQSPRVHSLWKNRTPSGNQVQEWPPAALRCCILTALQMLAHHLLLQVTSGMT